MQQPLALITHELFFVGIVTRIHESAVGGEQFTQHLLITLKDPTDEIIRVTHQHLRLMMRKFITVLEYLQRLWVLKKFVEKPQDTRPAQFFISKHFLHRRRHALGSIQLAGGRLFHQPFGWTFIGQRKGQAVSDLRRAQPSAAVGTGFPAQFVAEDGIGHEIHGRQRVAHTRDSAGFLHSLFEQLEEPFPLRLAG